MIDTFLTVFGACLGVFAAMGVMALVINVVGAWHGRTPRQRDPITSADKAKFTLGRALLWFP